MAGLVSSFSPTRLTAALTAGAASAALVAASAQSLKAGGLYASVKDEALGPVMAARDADWRIGPVVYQVLVDRFAPSENLDAKRHLYAEPRLLRDWSEEPARGELVPDAGLWTHEIDFWGGDLPSLKGRLDYIADLDIDVLYLNPIHQAYTNHKYDAQDYFEISEEFGTRADLLEIVDGTHERGMRLVLDGVLNHMGRTSPYFQEALADPNSPWREWFYIGDEYELGYRAWWNVGNLPDVNWESEAVRARLYGDEDSAIQGYLRDGVDGWRLDVAYDIGFAFLKDLTDAAHDARPGSLVLGEIYNYPEDWLSSLDGQLNITASEIIFNLIEGKISPRHAADIQERLIEDSDYEGLLMSWIVLDNHDRPRLHSRLPNEADRKLAQILQFTLPGAPNLYYGVELGLEGADDPENRGPMRWEIANDSNPDFVWTKTLTALRKDARALRIGEFRRLDADKVFAFSRFTDRVEDFTLVVVNPTEEPVTDYMLLRDSKIMSGEFLRDALTGEQVRTFGGSITITVPAKTAMVLRPLTERETGDYTPYKRVQ